jgi:hypothetical protein
MTLLTVVQSVCAVVGVTVPTTVTAGINANRTAQEMLALANEMAQRIAYDTRDWQTLAAHHTFIGDGIATFFAMPANFKRLMLTGNVRRTSTPAIPMTFVADLDQWMERRLNNRSDIGNGEWIIANNAMSIYPTLAVGDGAQFAYLDKNCIVLTSGGVGDSFMADTDTFLLDERLLKLGMIWQWKANKGTSYAEDMGTFTDALAVAMGHDKPAPIYIGRRPISASAKVAIPSQTIYFPGAGP